MTESAELQTGTLARPEALRALPAFVRARPYALSPGPFAAGVAACTAAVTAFLLLQLNAWPPHEDETLALFVGRGSLHDLLQVVLGERGGAPLHFLLASVVAHAGGGLVWLRLLSALCAAASIPVVALLVARLADRLTALSATALVSGSWVLLFHGVYGRMYSLFLLTSTLSYLAMLSALERGGRRRFVLWALASVLTVATHPYGALVLVSQGIFVILRRRKLREAIGTLAAIGVVCGPFWRADLVLAGRFDVGVGRGGGKLGAPLPVVHYLTLVAGDFSAGYVVALPVVLLLAAAGLAHLARTRPQSALLVAAVFAVPTLAFLVARLGSSTSPESRHLIFALPFFGALVAMPLAWLARRRHRLAPALALAVLLALVSGEVAWARHRTPPLFVGEPRVRVRARDAASSWLAETARPDDVFFGYDPLYLGAWERNPSGVSKLVVPRADATLAISVLDSIKGPVGRGVWVLDASDANNFTPKLTIPLSYPSPPEAFDARVFGPFLVIRSRAPTQTPERFIVETLQVMELGQNLEIGDADINLLTARTAARRYGVLTRPR